MEKRGDIGLFREVFLKRIRYLHSKRIIKEQEVYNLVRDFFKEFLDIDYEFTEAELQEELKKVFMEEHVRKGVDALLKDIFAIQYAESDLPEERLRSILAEFRRIVFILVVEKKKENPVKRFFKRIIKPHHEERQPAFLQDKEEEPLPIAPSITAAALRDLETLTKKVEARIESRPPPQPAREAQVSSWAEDTAEAAESASAAARMEDTKKGESMEAGKDALPSLTEEASLEGKPAEATAPTEAQGAFAEETIPLSEEKQAHEEKTKTLKKNGRAPATVRVAKKKLLQERPKKEVSGKGKPKKGTEKPKKEKTRREPKESRKKAGKEKLTPKKTEKPKKGTEKPKKDKPGKTEPEKKERDIRKSAEPKGRKKKQHPPRYGIPLPESRSPWAQDRRIFDETDETTRIGASRGRGARRKEGRAGRFAAATPDPAPVSSAGQDAFSTAETQSRPAQPPAPSDLAVKSDVLPEGADVSSGRETRVEQLMSEIEDGMPTLDKATLKRKYGELHAVYKSLDEEEKHKHYLRIHGLYQKIRQAPG